MSILIRAYITPALNECIVRMRYTKQVFLDPATQERLKIERERLELDKRRTGLSGASESESEIVLMPNIDSSLLDNSLLDSDNSLLM